MSIQRHSLACVLCATIVPIARAPGVGMAAMSDFPTLPLFFLVAMLLHGSAAHGPNRYSPGAHLSVAMLAIGAVWLLALSGAMRHFGSGTAWQVHYFAPVLVTVEENPTRDKHQSVHLDQLLARLRERRAVRVAGAGRHVVTGKPMATRWEDGKRIVAAADRSARDSRRVALPLEA